MDKKIFAIGVLTITAVLLLIANSFTVRNAQGYSVKDRDYQVVTAEAVNGGQTLYISDNRTGQIAVFVWDSTARALRVRDRRALSDAFQGK